jgi:hypothetical protein
VTWKIGQPHYGAKNQDAFSAILGILHYEKTLTHRLNSTRQRNL